SLLPRQPAQTPHRKPSVAVRIGGKRVAERHYQICLAPGCTTRSISRTIRSGCANTPSGIAARSTFLFPGARVPAATLNSRGSCNSGPGGRLPPSLRFRWRYNEGEEVRK
ncbi:MAG: hypothetical protein ACK559_00975, partial [bacterium]